MANLAVMQTAGFIKAGLHGTGKLNKIWPFWPFGLYKVAYSVFNENGQFRWQNDTKNLRQLKKNTRTWGDFFFMMKFFSA